MICGRKDVVNIINPSQLEGRLANGRVDGAQDKLSHEEHVENRAAEHGQEALRDRKRSAVEQREGVGSQS